MEELMVTVADVEPPAASVTEPALIVQVSPVGAVQVRATAPA
jgi:hypothetical protein